MAKYNVIAQDEDKVVMPEGETPEVTEETPIETPVEGAPEKISEEAPVEETPAE